MNIESRELDLKDSVVQIWSRRPQGDFTGSVQHHYETLLYLIDKCSKIKYGTIHTSPEIQSIFECLKQFNCNLEYKNFEDKVGTIDQRWELFSSLEFLRNKIVLNKGTENEQEIVVANFCG